MEIGRVRLILSPFYEDPTCSDSKGPAERCSKGMWAETI